MSEFWEGLMVEIMAEEPPLLPHQENAWLRWSVKYQHAAKAYTCELCGEPIVTGELYRRITFFNESTVRTQIEHGVTKMGGPDGEDVWIPCFDPADRAAWNRHRYIKGEEGGDE